MGLCLFALWLAAQAPPGAAQNELPRDVLLFSRLKHKMERLFAEVPDYTCVETIERFTRPTDSRPYQPLDTLRLEVAHLGDKELYAWPGAKFEDREPGQLIGTGTIGTGDFVLHARSVFLNSAVLITWHGEEDLNGRRALRWDYRIPQMFSGWSIQIGGRSGIVASEGSFWADAESLDLLRLEIHAAEIPPDLPVASVTTSIEYGRVRIGSSDVLLPQTVECVLTETFGQQSRNVTTFNQCRRYLGESVISFGEPLPETPAPAPRVTEIELPAGLFLTVHLETAIDSEKAVVGDPITASVQTEARTGKLVVPKGALLKGRIRRLDKFTTPDEFIVGLEFSQLEFDGKQARFFGRLEDIDALPGLSLSFSTYKSKVATYGHDRKVTTEAETIRTRSLPGVGAFLMRGPHFHLPAGLRMVWQTQNLRR